MRRAAETEPRFPPSLFVHQGSVDDGAWVFDQYWPAARAVADPDRHLYRAFAIPRARPWHLLLPALWRRAMAARGKGHRQGKTVGDAMLMPGAFLISADRVIRRHHYRHPGDSPPDFAAFARIQPEGAGSS